MAHIAVRSISTVGYIGATLLIAIVTILALVSFSNDGSGTEAVTTSTPTASPRGAAGAGPGSRFSSIAEGDETAGPRGIVNVRARACDEIPGITEVVTVRSAGDGNAWTDCGCTGGPVACVNGGSAGD